MTVLAGAWGFRMLAVVLALIWMLSAGLRPMPPSPKTQNTKSYKSGKKAAIPKPQNLEIRRLSESRIQEPKHGLGIRGPGSSYKVHVG